MDTAGNTTRSVKGLDVGTSRIVLATLNGESVNFTPQLNAFVDIPYSRMTEQMLARENILHQVEHDRIYAYGNRADEFAKFLEGDTRRPMQGGMLNPSEPRNLQMIELLLSRMCGRAGDGEKLCLSVPSAPPDRDTDLIYHERSVQGICQKLGYQAQVVNEGLAVVYSELKDANFTGIGMSFGGGMCNICVAYLGLPVLSVACAFRAVDAFTKVFDIVFGTTGGGPANDTQVFPLLIWQTAFSNLHFGEAASLSIFAIVISGLLGSFLMLFRRVR